MGLISELKRRNVIRVAVAYIVGAWLWLQATEVFMGLLGLPEVVGKATVAFLALGFFPVVAFAWVYELTPEGIRRESEVAHDASITRTTGRKLDLLIVVMLVVVIGYLAWDARSTHEPAGSARVAGVPAAAEPPDELGEPAADAPSVAVLPFVNMSAEADNEYFADGLSEEILNRLAQVPQLRVIGRTSSFAFKGQNRDLREIGSLLGAANILEGSVRRQGPQVRVTAQLIAAGDGTHLWSRTYDRRLDDVFAIQDEIAESVTDALNIVLDENTRQAMLNAGVRNVDAWVARQRGAQLLVDAHGDDAMYEKMHAAEIWYDRAIEAAPEFAAAYVEKSDRYAHIFLDDDFSHEERLAARDALQTLLNTAMEKVRNPQQRQMIEIDRVFFADSWTRLPGLLGAVFESDVCVYGNWMELAMPFAPEAGLRRHHRHAIACEPMMMLNYTQLAILQLRRGDGVAAKATLDGALQLGGDHNWLVFGLLWLDLKTGRAEAVLDRLPAEASDPTDRRDLLLRGLTLAFLGRTEEAETVRQELLAHQALSLTSAVILAAVVGDRATANAAATELDAQPGGPVELIRGSINSCQCGAPFDLEYTPNLAARLREAGWAWPPPQLLEFPAKDW